eukprot:CAMPEP_0176099562 /NCGR_PEP_ID=MMETSP0120_2-20121206/49930_1 /TAXON_ID=160619 /ORGANISM="Kryptoperidinium foliaceum, Strain CCMP 1326" /LENGTH=60 /DNA_ID=CAMNT_0017433593 /DNA_START=39 /DNA_END=222 /DNA_ORIENTATION=-
MPGASLCMLGFLRAAPSQWEGLCRCIGQGSMRTGVAQSIAKSATLSDEVSAAKEVHRDVP